MKTSYTTLIYLMMGGWLLGGATLYIVLAFLFSDGIATAIMFAVFLAYGALFLRVQKKAAHEQEEERNKRESQK